MNTVKNTGGVCDVFTVVDLRIPRGGNFEVTIWISIVPEWEEIYLHFKKGTTF